MRNAVLSVLAVCSRLARRPGHADIRDRSVLAEAAAGQMDHRPHRQHLRGRTRSSRRDQPARHHRRGSGDLHAVTVGADFRPRRQPRPFVRRLEHRAGRHSWLLRRSREQHLAHRQRRRHRPEVDPRREAAAADRQARRLRHDGRHRKGQLLNASPRSSSTPRESSSIPPTATSTSPTDTATAAWRCSTAAELSCVSGENRRRSRKSRPAPAARSRRSCTASR